MGDIACKTGARPSTTILRIIRGRFIEFVFSNGDPDLCIELILPLSAFSEFCRERSAAVFASGGGVDRAYRVLQKRHDHLPDITGAHTLTSADGTQESVYES